MRSSLALIAVLGLAALVSACAHYPEDRYYEEGYGPPAPPPGQYGPPSGEPAYGPPPSQQGSYGPPAPSRTYYRPARRHGPKWCANHPHKCAREHGVSRRPPEQETSPPPE